MLYIEDGKKYIRANDHSILWITDKEGNNGKYKFIKWFCFNHPKVSAKNPFGTTAQLRSSILKLGPKSVYFIETPPTTDEKKFIGAITVLKEIKEGLIVSNTGENLFMLPPHVIIFSNENCPMSEDRWKVFEIKDKKLESI